MIDGHRVIDADGHIHDWVIDWDSYVSPDHRHEAPTSFRDDHGFPRIEVEGRVFPEPGAEDEGLDYRDLEEVMARFTRDGKYWLPRPGESKAERRLPDMDEMGIDTAVLFGGHCLMVAAMVESPAVATTTLAAYNAYLAHYCRTDPGRLKGVAMLAMQAPTEAADELRRAVHEDGFVGGVLPPHHANGTTLDDDRLEPIWVAAEELDVPICIHTLGTQINPLKATIKFTNIDDAYGSMPSMIALGHLIMGGVLDRHPSLDIAFLETGAGWVPYFMDRIQSGYETFTLKAHRLPRDPEQYIRGDHLYFATEPDEALLPAVIDIIGADRLVLGSDYCHPEGKCPFTMRMLAERTDVSDTAKQKILADNPARLYRL
jgi:uncharacterized protein